nr:hypothetical protein [Bacteroides intestinalis]
MLSQLVCSKNNLFFAFLVAGYIFGVILYDFIEFKYTDELMALFLCLFAGIVVWERKAWKELIPVTIVVFIFLFYTIYSFIIQSNIPKAILTDLLIQIKPFLGFYCAYLIAPQLSSSQKYFISILCLIVGGLLIIVGLSAQIDSVFGHPSRFATAAIATAFLFLYCSTYKWSDVLIFLFLLTIGFFSTRAKFYGFWVVATSLIVFTKLGGQIRLNWKSIAAGILICLLAIWFAKEKIIIYYVDGMMNSREMWSRPAMLFASGQIFYDYFPFGCGLGSFGTFASAEYYSPIYEMYGLNHIWGLSKNMPIFICDAFYPELAQFGIIGAILYFFFWYTIIRKSTSQNIQKSTCIWMIFIFFLIEGIADSTFTHNRGLFILIILALMIIRKDEVEQRNI